MKKSMIILIISILILAAAGGRGIIRWLFAGQYNSKGVSHFLVITIDETQPREFIGKLEDHDVYIERLDIDGTAFRSVKADNITLNEAFEGNLVSIDEWRKYARRIKTEGNEEILQFENYEISVMEEECVIRLLRR